MKHESESLDERLARLGRSTEAIHPSHGFGLRVMAAIEAERHAGMWDDLWVAARRFVPVMAAVAVAGLGFAVASGNALDEALAASDDTVEIEW